MGHENAPPQLPDVTDEAANTPRWVPLLGALLFLTSIVAVVMCHGACGNEDQAADAAP